MSEFSWPSEFTWLYPIQICENANALSNAKTWLEQDTVGLEQDTVGLEQDTVGLPALSGLNPGYAY